MWRIFTVLDSADEIPFTGLSSLKKSEDPVCPLALEVSNLHLSRYP